MPVPGRRIEMTQLGLSRREREKLRQRQEIMDAALGLFCEKGYHNVSMHEIAKEAEFAIGTLYKFFRGKESLYEALMLDLSDKFRSVLGEAVEKGPDAAARLRNYVAAKGKVFCDNAKIIRLYFSETHGAGFSVFSGLDREIRNRRKEFLNRLAVVFKEGMEEGLFAPIASPFVLAVALDSLVNAFLFMWLEDPLNHPFPEDPNAILDILFRGLLICGEKRSDCRRRDKSGGAL
jgi:AcrR family transcriptional regulator